MSKAEMDKEIKRVEDAWRNGWAVSTTREVLDEMDRRIKR